MVFKPLYKISEKSIEIRKSKKRSLLPRVRKQNHLIVMFPTTDEVAAEKVKRELKKMTCKLDHLLENGISFEFHC